MKVFLSHSWKDKMIAHQVATVLEESGCEVWQDANELLPGQRINAVIERQLANADLIVLIWSEHAKNSAGVSAEIETIRKLELESVIPCVLDNTALPGYFSDLKSIVFADPMNGMMRLRLSVLLIHFEHFNMHKTGAEKLARKYNGILEIASHVTFKENIKASNRETEKDYWVDQIKYETDKAFESLTNQHTIIAEINAFLQEKVPQLEKANRYNAEKILQEFETFKHASHPSFQDFLVRIRKSLPKPTDAINKNKPVGDGV